MADILLFQKFVPSYRVGIFRELYKRFGILACHSLERKKSDLKSFYYEMDFPNEMIPRFYYLNKPTTVFQNIFPVLKKHKPKIIICEFSINYLTFWMLFFLKPFYGYKLATWSHGIKNEEVGQQFKSCRSKISIFIYNRVNAALFYSELRMKIISSKIKNKNKLFVAPNSIDTNSISKIRDSLGRSTKQQIQYHLNINSELTLVYIGRLIKAKRIDLICSSLEILVNSGISCSLHIIGDGVEKEECEKHIAKGLPIVLHGEIYDEKIIGSYLLASDLLINPGYIGLNIVHAFVYGLPVITCRSEINGPFHSPEIEYLVNDYNGIICSPSSEEIAAEILFLMKNKWKLLKLAENAMITSNEVCNIENMCNGFRDMIFYLNK